MNFPSSCTQQRGKILPIIHILGKLFYKIGKNTPTFVKKTVTILLQVVDMAALYKL